MWDNWRAVAGGVVILLLLVVVLASGTAQDTVDVTGNVAAVTGVADDVNDSVKLEYDTENDRMELDSEGKDICIGNC